MAREIAEQIKKLIPTKPPAPTPVQPRPAEKPPTDTTAQMLALQAAIASADLSRKDALGRRPFMFPLIFEVPPRTHYIPGPGHHRIGFPIAFADPAAQLVLEQVDVIVFFQNGAFGYMAALYYGFQFLIDNQLVVPRPQGMQFYNFIDLTNFVYGGYIHPTMFHHNYLPYPFTIKSGAAWTIFTYNLTEWLFPPNGYNMTFVVHLAGYFTGGTG